MKVIPDGMGRYESFWEDDNPGAILSSFAYPLAGFFCRGLSLQKNGTGLDCRYLYHRINIAHQNSSSCNLYKNVVTI